VWLPLMGVTVPYLVYPPGQACRNENFGRPVTHHASGGTVHIYTMESPEIAAGPGSEGGAEKGIEGAGHR
jgi:hypothetical protein